MTDAPKRILLTGASGYLGQHVLQALLSRDDSRQTTTTAATPAFHVYALYGNNQSFAAAMSSVPNVSVASIDLTDHDAIKVWLEQYPSMDICIHTAAMSSPRVCQSDPTKAKALNVPTAFFRLLEAQKCRIIALSTDQVYAGDTRQLYLETDTAQPVNVYGQSKLDMEHVLYNDMKEEEPQQPTRIGHDGGGTSATNTPNNNTAILLRSSIILGPKAPLAPGAHDTFLHFCATRQGQSTDFYSDESRSVVWVDDVVHTILWFIDHETVNGGGVYNMGGPVPYSRVELAQAVFIHLGFDPAFIVAKTKADLPPGPVSSPLDISMDSTKLERRVNRKFADINKIVASTFADKVAVNTAEPLAQKQQGTSSQKMPSRIKVLSFLEAYEVRQQEAQVAWKKSLWNITKAKRTKGANALGPNNAREELRPRWLLMCEETPDLITENKSSDTSLTLSSSGMFRLVDPVQLAQKKTKSESTSVPVDAASTNGTTGLRNRKAKELDSEQQSMWTEEEASLEAPSSSAKDEETKLSSIDTVQLFGLPTKELRQAKEEALRALNEYVEAANIVIEIQKEINATGRVP